MSDIQSYSVFSDPELLQAGLNMHAVLQVADLPANVIAVLHQLHVDTEQFRSLLVFSNGGSAFWRAFRSSTPEGTDPVDAFSVQEVKAFLARQWPGRDFRIPYPGKAPLALQTLGKLAGWHHDSPMKVGINDAWGLWYAYRAVVLLEGELEPSVPVASVNPCEYCIEKPCVLVCPPNALAEAELRLQHCVDFRVEADSACGNQCLARMACPVAQEHRYAQEQVEYHYGRSLAHIVAWRNGEPL